MAGTSPAMTILIISFLAKSIARKPNQFARARKNPDHFRFSQDRWRAGPSNLAANQ